MQLNVARFYCEVYCQMVYRNDLLNGSTKTQGCRFLEKILDYFYVKKFETNVLIFLLQPNSRIFLL